MSRLNTSRPLFGFDSSSDLFILLVLNVPNLLACIQALHAYIAQLQLSLYALSPPPVMIPPAIAPAGGGLDARRPQCAARAFEQRFAELAERAEGFLRGRRADVG